MTARSSALSLLVLRLSELIDGTYPQALDVEAHRWRRCAKVGEEAGEVVEALLGLAGENPRKGVTGDLGHVRKELLDVALAALGAVAHIDGNARPDTLEQLTAHAAAVVDRLEHVLSVADACRRLHPAEPCRPGDNHPGQP